MTYINLVHPTEVRLLFNSEHCNCVQLEVEQVYLAERKLSTGLA